MSQENKYSPAPSDLPGSHRQEQDGAGAFSRPAFPLTAIPQHERFLAERKTRADNLLYKGRVGRCPRCGKPNPAGVTRHCSVCRAVRRSEPLQTPTGNYIPTTYPRFPDEDGVTRYEMLGGVLEIRPDATPLWVPAQ